MFINPQREHEYQEQLANIVRESAWFMAALKAARTLGISSWCIGAGAVRNLVWDKLHSFNKLSFLPDIDVAYFDPENVDPERDTEFQNRLTELFPDIPWEVTNQAAVHKWYEDYFGLTVAPFTSLHEAIASWPEYATCVGVSLLPDNTIEVIAPYGLTDLFTLVVRHNPLRASVDMYRERLTQKRYTERWKKITVVQS